MLNIKVFLIGCLSCAGMIAAQAQNVETEEPKGKEIVQVFGNFHTGFGSENDDRGFELDRAYLGYAYDFGKGLYVKGVMDIGKSDDVSDHERIAYLNVSSMKLKQSELCVNLPVKINARLLRKFTVCSYSPKHIHYKIVK